MLNIIALKEIFSNTEVDQKDKVLACLAVEVNEPKQVKKIKEIGIASGFGRIKNLNVSSILSRQKGKTINGPQGWELSLDGRSHVKKLGGGPVVQLSGSLRNHLSTIKSKTTHSFVEEAIECFESHHYRAGVVLAWVGGLSVLYDHVFQNHLSEFNKVAQNMDPKWKLAKSKDDLARMKEANFLIVCESASIIGKSVKQELQNCLTFRNGCGHPNSLRIGENRVSGHIESLILNVFSVY